MSIEVGENSYVTIAEADSFYTTRPGTVYWFTLEEAPPSPGEESKEGWLVTAYYWLFDDSFGLPASSDNPIVKRAQLEAAVFLMDYMDEYRDRIAKTAGGVTSFMISRWMENLSSIMKPQNILDILYKAGFSSGSTFVDLGGHDY